MTKHSLLGLVLCIVALPAFYYLEQLEVDTVLRGLDRLTHRAIELRPGERLPISIVMIDHKTPQTLRETLKTYHDNALFDLVTDSYLYIQQIDQYPRGGLDSLQEFNLSFTLIMGTTENTYVHGAINRLMATATQPYVLLLEKDFQLVEPLWMTGVRLESALRLMNSERLRVVRMKSRRAPGAPEFARAVVSSGREADLFNPAGLGGQSNQRDLVCQTLYWLSDEQFEQMLNATDPAHRLGIRRCGADSWCFPPDLCHWTNQAVLVDRVWWMRNMWRAVDQLRPLVDNDYQRHNALEIAARYGSSGVSWLTGTTAPVVAVSRGLFSHRDMIKYPYDISVDDVI